MVGPKTEIKWPQAIRIVPVEDRPKARDYRLTLKLKGQARSLNDPSCHALFRTAAIMTAAAVSPTRSALPGSKLQAPRHQPSAAPKSPVTPRTTHAVSKAHTSPIPSAPNSVTQNRDLRPKAEHLTRPNQVPPAPAQNHLSISGRLGANLFNGLTPTLEVVSSLNVGPWEAALNLNYQLRQRVASDTAYNAVVESWGGRLLAGYAAFDPLWFRLGPALHLVRGTGRGDNIQTRSDHAYWLGLVAETVVLVDISPWLAAELAVHGRYSITRPRFQVLGIGEIFRVSRWNGGLSLGLRGQIL